MKEILEAERKHLENVIYQIKKKIDCMQEDMPYPGVSKYSVTSDKEECSGLMFQKYRNENMKKRILSFTDNLDEPYFARLDYSLNANEVTKFYIGKSGFEVDDYRIYDWRSSIGQKYYQKNLITFQMDDINYTLFLRRAFNINRGILHDVRDEYIYGDEIAKNKITDPFLVKIFEQKRNEYRVTDIIRSIQQNQNTIITAPLKEQNIVQGCAGSGKTMILMHRLSYIKFNNPNINFGKFIIITPSLSFNYFISDLAVELGIDKIDMLSIGDYYCDCLKQYDKDRWKKARISNVKLNQAFINKVYSDNIIEKFKDTYKGFMKSLYMSIGLNDINEICKCHNLKIYSSNLTYDSQILAEIKSFLKSTLYTNDRIIKECIEISEARQEKMKPKVSNLTKKLELREKNILSHEEEELFKEKEKLLDKHNINSIYNSTIGLVLNEIEDSYNIKIKKLCEYKAYSWLIFYSLFFGSINKKRALFISMRVRIFQ